MADSTFVREPNVAAPEAITAIVPSVAPLVRPIRAGSAKGFRKMPCESDPAIPSAAPAIKAPSARGNLISQTVVASMPSCFPISDQSEACR